LQRQSYGSYINNNNNNNNNNNKKVKPTFGISFGLPNQGGGGYPINPHGSNPLINPYGGSVGGQGINLGLVSVNPLISLQVTKDDYGEKILKPFVNLHVTPNNYLLHKFEDIFSYKKNLIFNKHKHFHYHKPNRHNLHYYPSYVTHSHPEYHHGPPVHDDSPVFHQSPEYHHGHGPVEFSGPPPSSYHDDGPDLYSKDPYHDHSSPISYYDDPHNYGGSPGSYYNNFHGRAHDNKTYLVDGNSLLNQYQQQYDDGQNIYGASSYVNENNFDDFSDSQLNSESSTKNFNSRGGKSLFPSNPIKFPTSRKRRDVTMTETFKPKQTKVK
jgi:hypothetical protein